MGLETYLSHIFYQLVDNTLNSNLGLLLLFESVLLLFSNEIWWKIFPSCSVTGFTRRGLYIYVINTHQMVLQEGDFIYIYMCVCVCVCVCNKYLSEPVHYVKSQWMHLGWMVIPLSQIVNLNLKCNQMNVNFVNRIQVSVLYPCQTIFLSDSN